MLFLRTSFLLVSLLSSSYVAAFTPSNGATSPVSRPTYDPSSIATDRFVLSSTAAGSVTEPLVTPSDIASQIPSILKDFQHHESSRLPYSPTGYSTWSWRTHHNAENQSLVNSNTDQNEKQRYTEHSINYLELGDPSKPAILLVHGFGASAYHFRHNIPILARKYHVYALDLLGFGWSDKPIMDYDASVWRDQVVDFVKQVILKEDASNKPITIAGNSLGGYTAMYSASDDRIKEFVKGCVLLNAAGRFRDPESEAKETSTPNPIIQSISSAIQRLVIAASFIYTKQPARIEQVLRNVYPVNSAYVDEELVQSIQVPSLDANAAEVFYRVITKNGSGPQAYVDDILAQLECPVLLAWGEQDPWIKSAAADKIETLYAQFHGADGATQKWCKRVSIGGGHCPHDEAPEEVNAAILEFVDDILGAKC